MSAPFWARGKAGIEGFGLLSAGDGSGLVANVVPPNPHDQCRLKGMTLPGVARIRALPTQDYKAEKAPGRDGATIILQGYLPGPIDIELTMWMEEQWQIWQGILQEIWRKPGKISAGFSDRGTEFDTASDKKRAERAAIERGESLATEQAISIESAALQPYNIQRVVVVGVSLPEPGSIPGSRVVNIKCMEWVPPPEKKVSGRRVKGSSTKAQSDAAAFDLPPANSAAVSPGRDPNVGGPYGPRRDPNEGKF